MTTNSYRQQGTFDEFVHNLRLNRGMAFGVIIITALLAFELFNYSTTDFALSDLLGDLSFIGVRWATILSIAFCSIDFAGIARLFTPEGGTDPHKEVWYLFGAWLLAATMNAMLTWWGVSIAILNHETLGNAVVERATLLRIVPIFVAVLVWIIRVLIIGTFSVAGDRLFTMSHDQIGVSRNSGLRRPNTNRALGDPGRNNQQGSRRLPATRSAKPARPFGEPKAPVYQPANRSFTSSPKPSGANHTNSTAEPQGPPEPEYISLDQQHPSTITAAPNSLRNKSGIYGDQPRNSQNKYRS